MSIELILSSHKVLHNFIASIKEITKEVTEEYYGEKKCKIFKIQSDREDCVLMNYSDMRGMHWKNTMSFQTMRNE